MNKKENLLNKLNTLIERIEQTTFSNNLMYVKTIRDRVMLDGHGLTKDEISNLNNFVDFFSNKDFYTTNIQWNETIFKAFSLPKKFLGYDDGYSSYRELLIYSHHSHFPEHHCIIYGTATAD